MRVFAPVLLLFLSPAGLVCAQTAAALKALETRYAEDRAASLRLVLARYADELEALQKKLLEGGDPAGAARVQLERDRVVPALGLPTAPGAGEVDEFAAFEESPPDSVPAAAPSIAVPGDLDAILKALLPPAAASSTGAGTAKSQVGSSALTRNGRRLLKMANAQLLGSYDPAYGYVYWSGGRSAAWTLSDLPPGSYNLQLRYTCDEKEGGGRLSAKFGAATLQADVPVTGTWKRKRDLVIGPFTIKEPRTDLILQPVSIRPGAFYLMELAAVLVVPVAAGSAP